MCLPVMILEVGTKAEGHLDIGCMALAHFKWVLASIKLTAVQFSSELLKFSREVAKGRVMLFT